MEANKQQTAVEWLVDYIKNLEKYPYKTIQELEEQAKEMEKEQIIEAIVWFDDTDRKPNEIEIYAEQYYNETYDKSR